MKITKEVGDGEVGIYKPDEKEQDKIVEVSDKIIDLITEEGLNDDQIVFLIECLKKTFQEFKGIDRVELNEDSFKE